MCNKLCSSPWSCYDNAQMILKLFTVMFALALQNVYNDQTYNTIEIKFRNNW